MTQHLLAAEADKIQDLIFRSARLREVVGGSQLLTRFCRETPDLLGVPTKDIIISDGGSFRILFDREDQAKAFGAHLAEVYRRTAGGSLTVAEPASVNGDFGAASKEAEENLRRAKRWQEAWQSQEHMPYIAFCASCGVGLAVMHRAYHENEDSQYLCASCLNKGAERPTGELGIFLEEFYKVVVGPGDPKTSDWPGKKKRRSRPEIDPLEDVADYDARRYVAYLLADGNTMGELFGECRTPEQMHALSEGLSHAVRKALAEPTKMVMGKNPLDDRPHFIPIYPLILGGDDLFALIPAPWALDFAQRFCQEYEREMGVLLERVGISNMPRPTISVAVVICKSKHPYALAHEVGKARLKEAKRLGKQLMLDKSDKAQPLSTVNFEVVLGGRLVSESSSDKVRSTTCPYWVTDEDISEWGLSLRRLIEQRLKLRNIPYKRLVELRSLYDPNNLPKLLQSDEIDPWQAKLERLLQRIEQRSEKQAPVIREALSALGGNETAYWRKVDRYPEDCWYGHGLPDLLKAWDFVLSLDKKRQDYEEER